MRGLLGAHVTWVSTLLCVQLALTSSPCPTGDRWSDPPASLATWPVGAGGGLQVTWTRPPRASLPITWYQVWARGDHGVGVNATAPQNDSEQLSVELSGLEPNTTYYIEVFPVSVAGDCVAQGPAASVNVTIPPIVRVESRGLLNCNTTCLSDDARTALIVVPLVVGIPTIIIVGLVLWKGCSMLGSRDPQSENSQLKELHNIPRTLEPFPPEQTRATWTSPDKTAS